MVDLHKLQARRTGLLGASHHDRRSSSLREVKEIERETHRRIADSVELIHRTDQLLAVMRSVLVTVPPPQEKRSRRSRRGQQPSRVEILSMFLLDLMMSATWLKPADSFRLALSTTEFMPTLVAV